MTTRISTALARCFRRPYLEAVAKYKTSLVSPSQLISNFIAQSAIDKGHSSVEHRLSIVPLEREYVHVSVAPRAESQSSGLSAVPGDNVKLGGCFKWISPTALTQGCDMWRTCSNDTPEQRGESVSALETEKIHAAEYRDLLRQRLESGSQSSSAFPSRSFVRSQPLYHQVMHTRYYKLSPIGEYGRWTRITGTYGGPLDSTSVRHPFLQGSIRFKSKNKMKKAKAKKKETLQKIKRMRMITRKSKEEMNPEERLEYRILKGRKKIELIKQAIAKFPVQEIPPEDPDIEVLTPEQMHYLKKIGYKNKNYVPVGRRGIYGGTIQNIHLHWKKHETVQVEIAGFSKEEIKVMAVQLARLSGGVLIDVHQNNIVILYRGRNYKTPKLLIPLKTLDKRKALAKSKLEQSMKALIENDKKVENLLAELRKENELRLAGKLVEGGGKFAKESKSEPEPKLEDPDEYSEWSGSDTFDDKGDDDYEWSGWRMDTDSEAEYLEGDKDTDSEAEYLEGDRDTNSEAEYLEFDRDTNSEAEYLEGDKDIDSEAELLEGDKGLSETNSNNSDTDSEAEHLEGDNAVGK